MSLKHRRVKRAYPTVNAWMDATGTTQAELAKALNISQSHLCNIMRKNRRASLRVAMALARLTNSPIENIASERPTFEIVGR